MQKTTSKKVLNKTVNRTELSTLEKPKKVSNLIEDKKMAKQELLGILEKDSTYKSDLKTPFLIIFATDLNGEKELISRDFLFNFLQGCLALNVKVVVVNTQQPSDLNNLGELTENDGRIVWYNPKTDTNDINREEKEIDRFLMAADMAIVFNNHQELVKLLKSYGVVLISDEKSPLLENYKPNEETGNSFLYKKMDLWSVFAALVRALETFKFPYDWNHIVRKIFKWAF